LLKGNIVAMFEGAATATGKVLVGRDIVAGVLIPKDLRLKIVCACWQHHIDGTV
jgi:hypothetical protein